MSDTQVRKSDPDELARLQAENRSLKHENAALRRFADCLQAITASVERSSTDADLFQILSELLAKVLDTLNAKDGSLLVLDDQTQELVFVITQGDIPQERVAWRRLPAGEGIAGWVVSHRRATIVNNAREDDRFHELMDSEFEFDARSVVAAPIIGAGQVLGVIEVLNKRESLLFSTTDQNFLTLICRFAGELLYSMIRFQTDKPGSARPTLHGFPEAPGETEPI